jgi:hypothetical protein
MSWLLRHGAEKEGLKLQDGGFLTVTEVVSWRSDLVINWLFRSHPFIFLLFIVFKPYFTGTTSPSKPISAIHTIT